MVPFVRATIRDMDGYAPGEQPAPGQRVVKLNTNENPYPPSPRVIQAIRDVESEMLRRYPSPNADAFRIAAAKHHGVDADMILAGNGSDDILTIFTRTFVDPQASIAYPWPTYSLYPVLSRLQDAQYIAVPWEADYHLPINALVESKAAAIYLANPNAPTGTFVPVDRIAALAKAFAGAVLVDEAYADFADDNAVRLVRDFPNVVISRTLSKAYSLAGLRFGYAIAQREVVGQMLKVKDSYNCDAISIVAATAAILDQPHVQRNLAMIRTERARVAAELQKLGWPVLPSAGNFVLATHPTGRGREAYLALKKQGILVRFFDKPGLADKLRITIGTPQENNALLGGIRQLNDAEKREKPATIAAG